MADQDPHKNKMAELLEQQREQEELEEKRADRIYRHWFETGRWIG